MVRLKTYADNWESELKQYITGAAYGNGALYIPEYHAGQPVRIIGINEQFGVNDYVTKVVIPDGVTKIKPNAFYGFNAANVEVEFGSNTMITEIGTHAFKDVKVASVVITGRNALTIGEEAFLGTSLVTFRANNLNTVGNRAFYGITTLKTVDLTFTGENATIGNYAFAYAAAGNQITGASLAIRGSLSEIKANAFEYNDVGTWKFDAKALTIGNYAFAYAKVSAVPTNVVTIGDYAYFNASIRKNGAGNVVVNDAVTIGKAAFRGSDITSFTFGSKLTTLYADNAAGEGSLRDTASLTAIVYGGGDVSNPKFGVKKNVLYTKDEDNGKYVAIKYPERADGKAGDLSLLTEIGYGAFRNSAITKAAFDVIKVDKYAFENCTSLVCVNNTKSEGLIFGSGLSVIAEGAFKGCTALKKIELQGLTSLTIESDAFKGCTGLVEVYVSSTMLTVEANAFDGDAISLATLDSRYIALGGTFAADVIFVPFYSSAEATAIKANLSAQHKIFYTPTECLVVNEDGKFCGGSSGCSLHEDHIHGTVYLPLYHAYNKRITGIFADENKLLDGDSTTELSGVNYVYGITYVYYTGTEYVTATTTVFTDSMPADVNGTAISGAPAEIGLN